MEADLEIGAGRAVTRRAGIWPYVALVLGIVVLVVTHMLAVY
jgi:hypothetical protein